MKREAERELAASGGELRTGRDPPASYEGEKPGTAWDFRW